MKRIILISIILILFALPAYADLNLLGQGTSTYGTYNLIYDTDLDITWYDWSNVDANWQNSMDWASALSVTFGSNVYNDWRLTTVTDTGTTGCNFSYSGTDCGYYVDTSTGELAHLWYDELGNGANYDTSGNLIDCYPNCLTNAGDFQNLRERGYWTGTEYYVNSDAWNFGFGSGVQHIAGKTHSNRSAMAVMDGMAVVPEPISSILFLTGGGLLAGRRFWRKINTSS